MPVNMPDEVDVASTSSTSAMPSTLLATIENPADTTSPQPPSQTDQNHPEQFNMACTAPSQTHMFNLQQRENNLLANNGLLYPIRQPGQIPCSIEYQTFEQQAPRDLGKQTLQTLAPFLTKHIPTQHGHSIQKTVPGIPSENTNSRYCYRHRPDLKCRRVANEPSMEQLQTELTSLPSADQQAISHVWSLFSAAPTKHRTLMLQGLLAQCCFPQLSFVSASVRELLKIDFLSALPVELALKILCYLDPPSLCKAAQVSQRWNQLANDDVVWHRMCEQHIDRKCTKCGWGLPLLDKYRLRIEKKQMQARAKGQQIDQRVVVSPAPQSLKRDKDGCSSSAARNRHNSDESATSSEQHSVFVAAEKGYAKKRFVEHATASESKRHRVSPESSITTSAIIDNSTSDPSSSSTTTLQPRRKPWKDVYRDRFRIGTNWKYNRHTLRTFTGHTNGVICLQYDGEVLASGSYDCTVKIWDMETGRELRTLRGHTRGVRCLQFDDSKLVSGSLDGTIKMWNMRTGALMRTLDGGADGVIGLHLAGSILACGSADKTIKVWDFKTSKDFVLRGHSDWVNSVRVDPASRTLFSASDDCSVRLWDLDSKKCVKVFEGHVAQVQQVLPLSSDFEFLDADEANSTAAQELHWSWAGWKGVPATSSSSSASASISTSSYDVNHSPYQQSPPSPVSDTSDSSSPHANPLPPRKPPPRYLLTAALDNTIRLWDVYPSPPVCVKLFLGHLEGIWGIAADSLRVVSAANDCMVKVWDPKSGKCESTIAGARGPVTCVGVSDRRLVAGSEDGEVRLYTFDSVA